MRLPDAASSRALLIGTSQYTAGNIADLPAVRRNLDGLAEILTMEKVGGFHPERCDVVSDPANADVLYQALVRACNEAEDTLFVYIGGHGIVGPRRSELFIAVTATDLTRLATTALRMSDIHEVLHNSRAKNRILVIDACYSGRAIRELLADDRQIIMNEMEIEGVYVLTSAPATRPAEASGAAGFTRFTGELIHLLRNGDPDAPELLTLRAIYPILTHRLARTGAPKPERASTSTADQLALTRNVGWSPRPQAHERAEHLSLSPARIDLGDVDTGDHIIDRRVDIHGGTPAWYSSVVEGDDWIRLTESSDHVILSFSPGPGSHLGSIRVRDQMLHETVDLRVKVRVRPLAPMAPSTREMRSQRYRASPGWSVPNAVANLSGRLIDLLMSPTVALTAIGACVVTVVGILLANSTSVEVAYASGDPPIAHTRMVRFCGGQSGACGSHETLDAFEWQLPKGTTRTTVVRPEEGRGETLSGDLRLVTNGCSGAMVRWSIGVGETPIQSGTLQGDDASAVLQGRILSDGSSPLTIRLLRVDPESCDVSVRWNEPELQP